MKKIYQVTEHCEEIRHKDMDWEKFNEDPINWLYSLSDQNFVDVEKEFDNEGEAQEFINEHPIDISPFPDYYLIRWYELGSVELDEDGDEVNYESIDASRLTRNVDKLNSIRDDIVAGLDKTEFKYVVLANEYFDDGATSRCIAPILSKLAIYLPKNIGAIQCTTTHLRLAL